MAKHIKLSLRHLHKAETHKETLIKFLLLATILVCYFGYLSWEYGLATGGIVSALTWSFFVLCTPVADAGFLLDFPIRLLFGIRMVITEALVWTLAIIINLGALTFTPGSYETTLITSIFQKILTTPFPYWSIIALCGLGTFLSIYFGDEMMDVMKHKDCKKRHQHGFKYRIVMIIALFTLIILSYYHLLDSLELELNLHVPS